MKQPCKFSCVGLYSVDVGEVLNKTSKMLLHVHLRIEKTLVVKYNNLISTRIGFSTNHCFVFFGFFFFCYCSNPTQIMVSK